MLVTNVVAQQSTPILPIDDIAGRWKVTKFGQDGYNAIDVADKTYCYVTYQITMKRTGGLGLDLLEYNQGKGNLGMVLVGDVIPCSNAAACGKFVVGDALTEISAGSKGQEKIERLEGNTHPFVKTHSSQHPLNTLSHILTKCPRSHYHRTKL